MHSRSFQHQYLEWWRLSLCVLHCTWATAAWIWFDPSADSGATGRNGDTAWWPQVTAHLFSIECRPVVFTPAWTQVIIANTCPTFGAGVNAWQMKGWRRVSPQDLFTVSVQHWHGFKDTKNTCCTELNELKLSCGNQGQRWGNRVNSVVTFFFFSEQELCSDKHLGENKQKQNEWSLERDIVDTRGPCVCFKESDDTEGRTREQLGEETRRIYFILSSPHLLNTPNVWPVTLQYLCLFATGAT